MSIGINKSSGMSSLLQQVQEQQQKVMRQLAAAKRITTAADDPAGMQIATRLSSQSTAMQRSINNVYDGLSLAQVAEGGMASVTDSLQRIRELAVQAGNGTLTDADRRNLQAEATQLREQIQQTIQNTNFGGRPVLNQEGTTRIFAGTEPGQDIALESRDLSAGPMANLDNLSLSSSAAARESLGSLDQMMKFVESERASLGAAQSRFVTAARQLMSADEHTQAARSRIEDLDFAQGMAAKTRNDILTQSALAMQAQANLQSQQVLGLLR